MLVRRVVRPSRFIAIASALSLSLSLSLGCSSDPKEPVIPETATSPTTPADPAPPADPSAKPDETPLAHSTLSTSPSCGAVGERVMLRLDWTADMRVPDCLLAEDYEVRFGSKPARITKLGKMNEGWCSLDVLVPKGAQSATVTVKVGHDVFESPTAFASPCP